MYNLVDRDNLLISSTQVLHLYKNSILEMNMRYMMLMNIEKTMVCNWCIVQVCQWQRFSDFPAGEKLWSGCDTLRGILRVCEICKNILRVFTKSSSLKYVSGSFLGLYM